MEASILKSTKKILGLSPEYTPFDLDILTHLNATFAILDQLGIGPVGGFYVEDEAATWDEFGAQPNQLNLVRSYVFLKVRMLFDPPATSFLIEAMNNQIDQFEWRLTVMKDEETLAEEVV